jgi:hypothetical protein
MGDDAVNEEELTLCCAVGCANCSILTNCTVLSCSGKVGLCCLNMEVCCKPGAPCLPCGCCGPKIECDGCSCVNTQVQCCCAVCTAAFPCNEEVPVAVSALGLTVFPKVGCCLKQKVSRNSGSLPFQESQFHQYFTFVLTKFCVISYSLTIIGNHESW